MAELKKKYSLIYEWYKKKKCSKTPSEMIRDIQKIEVQVKEENPNMGENEITDLAIGRFFAANKKWLVNID